MKLTQYTLAVAGILLVATTTAQAEMVTYEFSFTAAELMGYNTANGADGTSAADNDLYNGASAFGHADILRSYHADDHADLAAATQRTDLRLMDFNMWGFDNPQPGQGSSWGDDFRPQSYNGVAGVNPMGWQGWTTTYPWGDPPGDSACDQLRGWSTESWDDGINWNDADLADRVFTFQVVLDTDYAFYGNDTQGDGQIAAPNYADANGATITFWFGGYMTDLQGNSTSDYFWQTNMVLEGQVVPVPGAALLGSLGLGALAWIRRRYA